MKKAKRLLAVLLALVMVASCGTVAFARRPGYSDYDGYETKPMNYMNDVEKIELTAEQACSYILDLLDDLLYDANLNLGTKPVVDESYAKVTLKLDLTSIDGAFYGIYNLVKAVADSDKTCIGNAADIKLIGIDFGDTVYSWIIGALNLGDIESLNVSALGNQNLANERICRNPSRNLTDFRVLQALTQFLADNAPILRKAVLSSSNSDHIDLGTLSGILGDIDKVGPFINDFPGALKGILYPLLLNSEASSAPSGQTYDQWANQLANYALIDGTGSSADTGANSLLGADFEPLLPDLGAILYPNAAPQNQKINLTNISIYGLVNGAIRALLSGMVGDLLKNLLIDDVLEIDRSINDGKGDPEVLKGSDATLVNGIIGAIDTLFTGNGAHPIEYSPEAYDENGDFYPVVKINELVDWLLLDDGSGEAALYKFVSVTDQGIGLTDAFMSLLSDLVRLLPSLVGLLGLDVPEGVVDIQSLVKPASPDPVHGQLYTLFENQADAYKEGNKYYYLSNNAEANTTNPAGADYCNPAYIREKFDLPISAAYGAILKVVLYSVIKGCYIPDFCQDVASVGAYGLASLAARYLPENNYFERLDAYRYYYFNTTTGSYQTTPVTSVPYESVTGAGTISAAQSLPYYQTLDVAGQPIQVPRAAMDIGASIGSYFLCGGFDFASTLGYTPSTDTSFEVFVYEFLTWGLTKYMPVLAGKLNQSTHDYYNEWGVSRLAFEGIMDQSTTAVQNLLAQYPKTNNGTKSNIPGELMAPVLYNLLDNTVLKLFPANWLPQWIEQGGTSAFINWWLLNSVMNLDLQQLFRLFQVNPNGELNQPVMTVLLRVIDRALGVVFGRNALLPSTNRSMTGGERDPFTQNTSVTTLEGFLGGDGTNLSQFLWSLLVRLNEYIVPLGETIFPLIFSEAVKSHVYYETRDAATTSNYITENIDYVKLYNYYSTFDENLNAIQFSGNVCFTTLGKAQAVAESIGLGADYPAPEISTNQFAVTFPDTYSSPGFAEAAAAAAHSATGDDYYRTVIRDMSGRRLNVVMKSLNLNDETADCTVINYNQAGEVITSGEAFQRLYSYTNFRRAMPIYNGTNIRTGPNGEVVYNTNTANGSIFRTFAKEDFKSENIYYFNRLRNALDDASEFLGDFNTYATSTLSGAYNDWIMYYVKSALKAKNLYDKNDDGQITDDDTAPGIPSSDYPFIGSSATNIVKHKTNGDINYNLAYPDTSKILAYAVDVDNYGEDDNGNSKFYVKLSNNDTEAIVRLAINNRLFDITPDADGHLISGGFGWENANVTAAKINALLTKLGSGWSYNETEHAIYRPAFRKITSSTGGDAFTVKTPQQLDRSADPDEERNDIYKAYIGFAENVKKYEDGLLDYYDNISWRASRCETFICTSPDNTALQYFISKATEAYYPSGNSENGRNKVVDPQNGVLINKYSTKTFDAFQRAYDYALALSTLINTNANCGLPQSMVSEAYYKLLDTLFNLKLAGGLANWTALTNYINMATDILNGDLGLNADDSIGYTKASLLNLQAELNDAITFKNENVATLDDEEESQELVDQAARDLYKLINALAFPEGVTPDIVINPDYNGDVQINNYGAGSSITYGIITGLIENVGFNDGDQGDYFIRTGYTYDESIGNDYRYYGSGQGSGTGASIVGRVLTNEKFRYYAVLFGDINGDARIDNTDSMLVNMYVSQNRTGELAVYKKVASDVDNSLHAIAEGCELKSSASAGSATVTLVPAGTAVTVNSTSGEWSNVTFNDGTNDYTGYVLTSNVNLLSDGTIDMIDANRIKKYYRHLGETEIVQTGVSVNTSWLA